MQKPDAGYVGGKADILESVYFTLFLGIQKLRNFLISVKNEAMVDALWICNIVIDRRNDTYQGDESYSAWGFCIARSTDMGNAKATECVNEQKAWLSRFFYWIT